jgi:hypothetical protein
MSCVVDNIHLLELTRNVATLLHFSVNSVAPREGQCKIWYMPLRVACARHSLVRLDNIFVRSTQEFVHLGSRGQLGRLVSEH